MLMSQGVLKNGKCDKFWLVDWFCLGFFLGAHIVNTVNFFLLFVGWRQELHEVLSEEFDAFCFASANFWWLVLSLHLMSVDKHWRENSSGKPSNKMNNFKLVFRKVLQTQNPPLLGCYSLYIFLSTGRLEKLFFTKPDLRLMCPVGNKRLTGL